jgi:hypothetical protein
MMLMWWLLESRIQSQAMFASARNSVGGMFIAIDPEQENTNNNLFLKAMIARGMLNDDSSILLALYASHSLSDESELALGLNLAMGERTINGIISSELGRYPAALCVEYRLYF